MKRFSRPRLITFAALAFSIIILGTSILVVFSNPPQGASAADVLRRHRKTPTPITRTPTTTTTPTTPPTPTPTNTPPPTPTPTTPPTPTPTSTVPPTRTWPTAENTGASGALTDVKSEVILNTAGQVYKNMRIDGTLTVTACNVQIVNVEVIVGATTSQGDVYAIFLKHPETCSVTLDHVTILTKPAPNNYVSTGVRIAYGSPTIIKSTKIIGTQDGVLGMGSGLLQDSYIELGKTMNGEHNDGFQLGGSDSVTIKHNTILNPNAQTSALALFTEWGPNKNMLVEDNLLAGGGYTCYCGDGATDNQGNPARSVNVTVRDNVFWRKYYPGIGYYGYGRAYNPAGGGSWQNNLFMNADGTLTNELVPQPGIDK